MTLNDWQRVAREFGDYDHGRHGYDFEAPTEMVKWEPHPEFPHRVGDWLPSEPTAKEILRLRKRVEVLERVRFAAQCVEEAKMHAVYCDRVTIGGLVCTCGHASLKDALDAAKEAADGN